MVVPGLVEPEVAVQRAARSTRKFAVSHRFVAASDWAHNDGLVTLSFDRHMTPRQATPFVLVTGATGNVGSQTVELLLAAGVPVRAAASSAEAVSS